MKKIKAKKLTSAQRFTYRSEPFLAVKRDGQFAVLSYMKPAGGERKGIPTEGRFLGFSPEDILCVSLATGKLLGLHGESEVEVTDG